MLTLQLIWFCLLAAVWADYVDLPHGRLQGHRLLSRKGREIFSFQGIPYAKPPVGELRFQPPQPPEPWTGVLKATKEGPDCIQRPFPAKPSSPEIVGDEDCLYLNVYTPQLPEDEEATELLPVMFWIHGGGWVGGSGSTELYGPKYLLDKEIVLVTINYRLGPLGFLSTGDEVCPGNNGFKDQVAALRWVRDNIAAFGGNPGSVTIFGESAGGASVHYLVLSEVSRGLIHRGISQSGAATCMWALTSQSAHKKSRETLAADVGCPTQPSSELISCLRNVDAEKIIRSTSELIGADGNPKIPFGPVIENVVGEGDEKFISKSALETILSTPGEHLVPWMAGFTSGDGAILVATMFQSEAAIQKLDEDFENVVHNFLSSSKETSKERKKTVRRIREFYFGNKPINKDARKAVVDMYTDLYFSIDMDSGVKLHSKAGATVYYYYFDYRGENSFSSIFGGTNEDYGVCHMDELMYLFPQDHIFSNSTKTTEDDEMVDIMTTIWTNFARTGNPTSEACNLVKWRPVSSPKSVEYGHIDSRGLRVKSNLLKENLKLWSSIALTADGHKKKDEL
ncbi:carboxylic ester hydrolase-like isoform X2 [Periplaneta americana]|uniref:carboxylic ester hydrolase-like isoform X2 n=1 Tax=Periplaneta americana TaxID=6978 RepID=UPI0037E8E29B